MVACIINTIAWLSKGLTVEAFSNVFPILGKTFLHVWRGGKRNSSVDEGEAMGKRVVRHLNELNAI